MIKKRFLAVFFAMLIAFSTMWTFSVSAVEGEGESVPESEYVEPDTSEDVTYESEDTQPETEDTAPVTEDTQPQTQDTQSQDDSDYTQGQQSEDTQPQYNDDDNYDWNSGDDADYGNYEERENNTSSEKASTAAVYNAEKDDVSKDTLNEGDWAKIAAQLKNASQSGDDDFAFIRNNDASGANNGEWMLILGIAMEAVAVGLIGFMIYLSVKKRKALKSGAVAKGGNPYKKPRPESAAPAAKRPVSPEAAKQEKHSVKRRSKFDTADIVLPKKEEPSGRYKPRH